MFFYNNINVKENVFFQSASWKRDCATHWREQRGWDLVTFDWFVLSMRMQVILDSSFAGPGSAPIWGGKKARRVQGLDYGDCRELNMQKSILQKYCSLLKPKILK